MLSRGRLGRPAPAVVQCGDREEQQHRTDRDEEAHGARPRDRVPERDERDGAGDDPDRGSEQVVATADGGESERVVERAERDDGQQPEPDDPAEPPLADPRVRRGGTALEQPLGPCPPEPPGELEGGGRTERRAVSTSSVPKTGPKMAPAVSDGIVPGTSSSVSTT